MGGQEAIGVLVGGIVRYYLVSVDTVTPLQVVNYNHIDTHLARCDLSLPLDMYFSDLFLDEENTQYRFIIIKPGHIVFRRYGDTQQYELKRI